MRVTVNFDKYVNMHREFGQSILALAKETDGDISFVGNTGISVAHLSWHDAFRFGAKIAYMAGRDGTEFIETMRMYVQEDIESKSWEEIEEGLLRMKKEREKNTTQAPLG